MNLLQVVAFGCRINVSVREYVHTGEGAISNCQQLIDLVEDYTEHDKKVPFIRFVDDECSNVIHLLKELVAIARGTPIRHSSIFGVLVLLCMDGSIDAFHFKRCHKELFCKLFLNPNTRLFPEGWNSEAVEQNWQELVKMCPSLTYMTEGNFRFFLLSIIMMENMARARTPSVQESRKASKRTLDNLGQGKHSRNRELAHGKKKKTEPSKTVHGRLPIPPEFVADFPNGFDPRLAQKNQKGKRVYTHFDASIIRDGQDELIKLIRTFIPQQGFGRPPVAALFNCRMAMQKWLVSKVVAQQPKTSEPNWGHSS